MMNNIQNVNKNQHKNYNHTNDYVPTIFDFFSRPLESLAMSPFAEDQSCKVDIKDDGDHYQIKAQMPGVKKEDIKLDFNDGILSISAEHNVEKKHKNNDGFLVMECNYGTYQRQFRFDDVDPKNIDAAFVNGELDVYLKKQKNENSCHQIKIN
ncbi:MAG: Hsp20/alpha crystallin family protein [Succinivibrio sp.]|nr:Hsp20/alpha crystallin family protein [Succinivibrio sp.]MCI5576866.1 Hsp20/alpha crystallin family protein [Succinivibrio sp.]MCI7772598.1 Hsp20/alpha crystallin family protein [Succinivibrio sp.]MCI7785404.1 Hsp20/alpha crystallin family protein [Succinivibrio sp.]MDD6068261.1 Hsp20/alpha crystallin family protein [Succinivibrio sp.]